MKTSNYVEHEIENKTLVDKVVTKINNNLAIDLEWLSRIYGVSEGVFIVDEGKHRYLPVVYSGVRNDYEILVPDGNIGSFSFIEFEGIDKILSKSSFDYYKLRLCVSFDYNDIYSDITGVSIHNVIKIVMDSLKNTPNVSLRVDNYSFGVKNVYRGYDYIHLNPIYWMRPNGCLSIQFTVNDIESCS